MTEKSHVGMGVSVCPICYKEHDEVVLLDKQLRPSLTNHMFMGWDICPEHKAMEKEFIALVECSNPPESGRNLKPENAKPTGQIAHIKREVADSIFRTKFPADLPFVYVEVGVIDALRAMQTKEEGDVSVG